MYGMPLRACRWPVRMGVSSAVFAASCAAGVVAMANVYRKKRAAAARAGGAAARRDEAATRR